MTAACRMTCAMCVLRSNAGNSKLFPNHWLQQLRSQAEPARLSKKVGTGTRRGSAKAFTLPRTSRLHCCVTSASSLLLQARQVHVGDVPHVVSDLVLLHGRGQVLFALLRLTLRLVVKGD